MKYDLVIESRAKKDIKSLDPIMQKRLAKKLQFYLNQPDPLYFAKRIVDPADGDYQWRIGHYRVVFDVKGSKIILLKVQHRKDVYR